ncbi:MAG TPA: AMP-binding protein, partial [Albitalea sp.]|nr:AMP-binding protein [Albitalea sp.]
RPFVIEVEDDEAPAGASLGDVSYEAFLAHGDPAFAWQLPSDEWNAISLNYTSGTTGNPKGVVTHHRGAYLNAASNVIGWSVPPHATFLWTLPMFHCNGWCFPWTMALVAGTSVCLRRVDPAQVFALIRTHHVTHLCGAPIVYSMLLNAPAALREGIAHTVQGLIAGAAPPAAVIEACEAAGIELTHVYGLTEVYGPAAVCAKQESWAALPAAERARLNGRQGVACPMQQAVTVLDPLTMQPVPADGETIGEIFFRGNVVMKGYLKNPAATREAFAGGWFHTGDLGVMHPDGYVKVKDRSKDIIISGGENISSIEVEDALHRHPAVMTAAVVAEPDAKWGEVPCAFVELKPGAALAEAELIEFCRGLLARFKAPKRIVFGELPKTSTGKIQKFMLRDRVRSASAIE